MKKLVTILLTLMLLTSTVSGFVEQAKVDYAPEEHEVYKLIETTIVFDGLRPPKYESRADIPKALPKEKDDEVYIGFPISRMSSETFVNLINGVAERCESYGYRFEYTDAGGALQKQTADLEAFITKGVDAIIVNPIDPISVEMDVSRAVEQDVIVVGCGIAFYPSAGVLTCVWSNNYESGFDLGVSTAKAFSTEEDINLGMIIGRFGQSMCESRGNGFVAGMLFERMAQLGKPYEYREDAMLEGYEIFSEFRDRGSYLCPDAKMNLLSGLEGLLTFDNAMKVTEDMLTAHPNLNLIYCENDDMGEGVVQALKIRGVEYGNDKPLKLTFCGGANKPSMDMLKNNELLCTIHNNPKQNGYVMVDLIHNVLENNFDANNLTVTTFSPVIVLTAENVDEYYDDNEFYPTPVLFSPISVDEWNAGHQ